MSSVINAYLRKSLQKVASKCRGLTVVMGNEAGDLDSVVGSIFLAMLLNSWSEYKIAPVVPAINFPLCDLPLRTDVYHLFNMVGIDTSLLISVVPGETNQKENYLDITDILPNVVLYDHNTLSVSQKILSDKIVGIIDHHFDDKLYDHQSMKLRVIETVGSACTLVAELYKKAGVAIPSPTLLLSPIILDTVNFDPQQQKTTPKDLEMFEWLASMVPEKIDSHEVYERLSEWKKDIFGLTLEENFRRDYKFFSFEMGARGAHLNTGISSTPSSYEKFKDMYSLEKISSSCYDFLNKKKLDAFILVFSGKKAGVYTRDIVFVVGTRDLQIFLDYTTSFQPSIVFHLLDEVQIEGSHVLVGFSLSDTSTSRKFLVPSLGNFLKARTQSLL